MAKIVPSDLHPDEEVRYGLGPADSFSLAQGGSHDTTDQVALGNAEAHPWLNVERDEAELLGGEYRADSVDPKDDALSALNSVANDPDAVREALEGDQAVAESPLAVDAGLDQSEPVEIADTAVTLAADDTDTSDDDEERSF